MTTPPARPSRHESDAGPGAIGVAADVETDPVLTPELLAALPKVSLHDHLDGGVRPSTLIELAAGVGHELPSQDPEELGRWFVEAADSGSLERYLDTFEHTVAVMQTSEGLARVARDAVVDLAADGVVYGELRYAPEQHQRRGLRLQEIVDAVQEGLAEGVAEVAAQGGWIRVGTLLSAMRQGERSLEVARLALANREGGVVGFDLAGPEDGYPATRHRLACELLRSELFPVTIHAGEAFGVASIAAALEVGALRLGHGIRLLEDVGADGSLGPVAQWVLDRQVPLEVAPSSNLQTGGATSIASHPVTRLRDLGFAVTVNTDNRLQSGTSLTRELTLLAAEADWSLTDIEEATLQAAWNAFAHRHVVEEVVVDHLIPAFEAARTA